jgi:hypothetical protein
LPQDQSAYWRYTEGAATVSTGQAEGVHRGQPRAVPCCKYRQHGSGVCKSVSGVPGTFGQTEDLRKGSNKNDNDDNNNKPNTSDYSKPILKLCKCHNISHYTRAAHNKCTTFLAPTFQKLAALCADLLH